VIAILTCLNENLTYRSVSELVIIFVDIVLCLTNIVRPQIIVNAMSRVMRLVILIVQVAKITNIISYKPQRVLSTK
jgi:hypothetical protein